MYEDLQTSELGPLLSDSGQCKALSNWAIAFNKHIKSNSPCGITLTMFRGILHC